MEDIIEFLLELIIEGGIAMSEEKTIPKWIRYPVIFVLALLSTAFIGFMFYISYEFMLESKAGGILTLIFTFILIGCIIYKVRKIYKENYKDNNNPKTYDID